MPPSAVGIVEGREIHPLRAADADVDHVNTAVGQATAQRIGQARTGQSDIPPHHHAFGVQELRIARPTR